MSVIVRIQLSIGEILALTAVVISALVLIATYCTHLINYYRRPKLVLTPWRWVNIQKELMIGLKVKNVGKSVAKETYGSFESYKKGSKGLARIMWNDSVEDHMDIYPGSIQEYWFYIARLRRESDLSISKFIGAFGTAEQYCEIRVDLHWEYHGLRTLTAKFALDLKNWDSARLKELKNCV